LHVPTAAKLLPDGQLGVAVMYYQRWGQIALKIVSGQRLEYTVSGDPSLAAHFTILPHLGESVATAAGDRSTLSATSLKWYPGAGRHTILVDVPTSPEHLQGSADLFRGPTARPLPSRKRGGPTYQVALPFWLGHGW